MATKPTKPLPKVTSWSFTRYSDYNKCPAFFRYKHLEKISEPGNDAMQRGSDIHKLAENYTKGIVKKLPEELALFAEEFAALKKQKIKIVEDTWAFKADWSETVWNDWAGCWLRIKMDAAYVNVEHMALVPIDHKTGKCRDEEHAKYLEQLELYAIGGLLKYPEVKVVSPRLWYLDHGIVYPDPEEHEIEFVRADLPGLQKKWEKKVIPIFKDTTFKPTPSDSACRWCYFGQSGKAKGGPGVCRF